MKSYKIVETDNGFLCAVLMDNELFGAPFECQTHEQMFAWFRLMVGYYPGMTLNDEAA